MRPAVRRVALVAAIVATVAVGAPSLVDSRSTGATTHDLAATPPRTVPSDVLPAVRSASAAATPSSATAYDLPDQGALQARIQAAARAQPAVFPSAAPAPAAEEAVIAPPPEEFDAPPEPAAPPPSALQERSADRQPAANGPTGTGVWAVVIGINDYPGRSSDLRSAVNDAHDVAEALRRYRVPSSQVLTIVDRQASAGVVLAAADWLVANAGPDATAVFFYAGHVRKTGSNREVIVAADGGLVSDAALADRLAGLAAERAWIAIAACYGGGFTEVLAPGRVLSAAAGPNSLAYENAGYGRSYMVQYMVRLAMIEGRAASSVQAAFDFAVEQLRRDHPNRLPYQIDRAGGPLTLGPTPAPTGGSSSSPPPPPPDGGGGGGQPSSPPPEEDDDDCLVSIGSVINCG